MQHRRRIIRQKQDKEDNRQCFFADVIILRHRFPVLILNLCAIRSPKHLLSTLNMPGLAVTGDQRSPAVVIDLHRTDFAAGSFGFFEI